MRNLWLSWPTLEHQTALFNNNVVMQGNPMASAGWVCCCLQVAMIGSGAWACAAMHIVAQNCAAYDEADEFVDDVRMWVYEEDYPGGILILHLKVVVSLNIWDAGSCRQQPHGYAGMTRTELPLVRCCLCALQGVTRLIVLAGCSRGWRMLLAWR